jgi:molybdenum cofactor synthesis domain-containing protein
MINLEIISIGNELLIGIIQNTNAFWLSKQATQLGVNVTRETTIPDIIHVIAQTLNQAIQHKPNFIITTGGLGPTFDDKTFEAIAKALNRPIEVNPQALNFVKEKCETYAKKHDLPTIEMTPPRIKMAALPQGTQPINNPVGTAPGLRVDLAGVVVFVLPGVPMEMEAIFSESIAPALRSAVGGLRFFERSLFADCIAEAALAPLIDVVMRDNLGVYIKSHPLKVGDAFRVELHLTLTCSGDGEEKLQNAADQLARLIEQNGGKHSLY